MNNLDKEYQYLLEYILGNGVEKKDRTGTGTLSIFGWQIRHNMKEGFPLLTTKKMHWKSIVTELLWFLRGDTNIKYLVDNECHIWDGDAYKNYENIKFRSTSSFEPLLSKEEFINKIKTDDEFAREWGELGPIYGQMWRDWDVDQGVKIDQIKNLIKDLKTNPDSRRLMVNAWNPTYIQHAVLPPCHYGFQVYTRELSIKERIELWEKIPTRNIMDFPIGELAEEQYHEVLDKIGVQRRAISLMWNQRSVDTFLGLPFNIASYGLLLEILAKEVNMVPDELIGNLGDCHLYLNHVDQAKEQIGRKLTIEERVALIPEGILSQETIDFFNKTKNPNDEILSSLAGHNIQPNLSTREPFELPKLIIEHSNLHPVELVHKLENYQSHPSIKAPLSN